MSRCMHSTCKTMCMCVLKSVDQKSVRVACNVRAWEYLHIIRNQEVHVCELCAVHVHLYLYVRIHAHVVHPRVCTCDCVYTIEHVDMRLCTQTHSRMSTCSYFMCIHAARTFHVYACNTHISCVFLQHAPAHVFVRDLTPIHTYTTQMHSQHTYQTFHTGWLRLVGSLKLYVSFAKEPYERDDILKRYLWF